MLHGDAAPSLRLTGLAAGAAPGAAGAICSPPMPRALDSRAARRRDRAAVREQRRRRRRGCYPRLQLRLEPGSRAAADRAPPAARRASAGTGARCNVTIELGARRAADALPPAAIRAATRCSPIRCAAQLAEQARYQRALGRASGAGTARTSAHVQLAGRGAALAWQAIAVGRGQQVHDIALKVEHTRRRHPHRGDVSRHRR